MLYEVQAWLIGNFLARPQLPAISAKLVMGGMSYQTANIWNYNEISEIWKLKVISVMSAIQEQNKWQHLGRKSSTTIDIHFIYFSRMYL